MPSLVEEPLLERSYLCVFRREFAQVPLPANNTRITHKNISGYTRVLYNSLLSGPSARHMPFPIPAPQMPCIRTCKYMNMTLHLYARHTARTRASHLRTTAPRKNHYCGGSCCRACVTCRTQHQHPLCTHYDVRHRDGT